MNRSLSALTAIILIPAFMTGCVSTDPNDPNAADADKTRAQGAGIGAGLGAVAGGLIGYAVGGSSGAARGALIGAGAGGVAGFAYGNHVAGKKAQYANTEAYLDAVIASAQQVNNEAYAYNNKLQGQLGSLKQQVASAKAANDRAAMKAAQQQLASARKDAEAQAAAVNRELEIQRNVYETEKDTGSDRLSALNTEIGNLETRKSQLQKSLDTIASLDNQLDV